MKEFNIDYFLKKLEEEEKKFKKKKILHFKKS